MVDAPDSSSLSFDVSGIVKEMRVDVGDRITQGQVLAVLDDSSYRLTVDAAA